MRATTLFSTLALGAALVAGGAILAPVVLAQMGGNQPASTRQQWLSLTEIQQRLEAAGYRDIDKIEREDDYYEVKGIDPDGRRVELKLDPVSGEVTKSEAKNGRRERSDWLTPAQLQVILESAGYRDIDKIERESRDYEVRATDAEGRRVELDVDPHSGAVTKTEVKSGKRDERSMNGTRSDEPMVGSAAQLS
ncbi:MAG TPA: PepSY domain-containing protein [Rhodocyclaceae bacterium]|nr:PepSY domain-containing protein [Rhodocyclaceae bacterium]